MAKESNPMAHEPNTTKQELAVLLAHRRQFIELYLAEQRRLLQHLTDSGYQTSAIQLVQLSRFVTETDEEIIKSLQIPLRPSERRRQCRKALRE